MSTASVDLRPIDLGFEVGQTRLRSDLPLNDRIGLEAVVARPGAAEYAFESFVDEIHEEWLGPRVVLQHRMSTDAPVDDLAKAANALLLGETLPEVTSVRTWNSTTNEHMLAVNRALGYAVDGYSREWQKTLG